MHNYFQMYVHVEMWHSYSTDAGTFQSELENWGSIRARRTGKHEECRQFFL